MLKTTNTLTAFSATALITFGCAENNTNQQSQQSIQDAVVVVEPQSQPLPIWESHLEPYGFVSSEGAVAYETYVLDAYQDHPEDADDYYDIIGNSCSWYCGGEANNVTASSTRPDEGSNTYKANNAHDLRYDTAWVEGVDGPGLGETLTYTFTNKCPRITGILIHTGYIKDEMTWIKNNRVRTLELAINGEPAATLELTDTRAEQSFDLEALGVGPLGRRADGEDLILTFTIKGIYPGTTYDDTAISEIYFDGIDVH